MNQPNQPNQPMFIVAPKQKKRRRWLRFFAGLAVMMILLLVVVYFVATSPAFIKSVVLPRVGDALHANVTVSDISLNPFKQIALRDLTVQVRASAFARPAGSQHPVPFMGHSRRQYPRG